MNGDDGNTFNESYPVIENASANNFVVDPNLVQTFAMELNPDPNAVESVQMTFEANPMVEETQKDEKVLDMPITEDSVDSAQVSQESVVTPQNCLVSDDTGQAIATNPIDPSEATEHEPKTMDNEQMKELLNQCIEFFFSRENWSSDRYLLSQMDSDQYVPVYILAECSNFKSITKDQRDVLQALRESTFVQLDEEMSRVRPNFQRCIVILREISNKTAVEEIQAMFMGEGCPQALSCEFIHNDVWYVTFESDADAQKAYRFLRETVKTFNDKPILARIKTKPVSKTNCYSVLPSYAGKGNGGEALKNVAIGGPSAATAAPPAAIGGPPSAIPNPPPPPNPYSNNPRMFYPNQNNISPSTYPGAYNYSNQQMQTAAAYFYPNPLIPWSGPPSFYDVSSFVQYNGLQPKAAYKPYSNNARFANPSATNARSTIDSPPEETLSLASSNNGQQTVNSSSGAVPPPPVPVAAPPPSLQKNSSEMQGNRHSNYEMNLQPQRPISRGGGRRRISRREDENNGNGNSRMNRGSNQEGHPRNIPEARRPHFELQEKSFPPLCKCPADEIVPVVPEEKAPEPVAQVASKSNPWGGESSHTFSDVMKGTAKPKPVSSDKESSDSTTAQPVPSIVSPVTEPSISKPSSSNNGKTTSSKPSNNNNAKTIPHQPSSNNSTKALQSRLAPSSSSSVQTSQPTTNHLNSQENDSTEPIAAVSSAPSSQKSVSSANESGSLTGRSDNSGKDPVTSTSSAVKGSVSVSTASKGSVASVSNSSKSSVASISSSSKGSTASISSASKGSVASTPGVVRDNRPNREDRRGVSNVGASGPHSNRREFQGGMNRGTQRRSEGGYFRTTSGNKENRPQPKVPSQTHREDSDGWITKTRREKDERPPPHRFNNHPAATNSYYENRNHSSSKPLVNGDSSPPISPKVEKVNKPVNDNVSNKVSTNNSKNANNEKSLKEENIAKQNEKVLNNNDGEHKRSWAKVALGSKDTIVKLSTELKEKEEQEKMKKHRGGKPNPKLSNERPVPPRETKPFKSFPVKDRDASDRPRDFKGPDNRNSINLRQREQIRSKSPVSK